MATRGRRPTGRAGSRGPGGMGAPEFPDPIRVEGLRELRSALRAVDKDLAKRIRMAGNVAAQLVVDEAKPRVPLGPGRGGHAVSSIKVASTGKAARISAGGKRYPYYPWLDFGGRVGRGKATVRPFIQQGRYIWDAFDDRRADVERVLAAELQSLVRAAGLEVRG